VITKNNKKIRNLFFLLILLTVFVPVFGQKTAPNPNRLLRSGPMLGYSEMTETVVWLQTKSPAGVYLKYWKRGDPKSSKTTKIVQTNEENDHLARFKISNLAFGTHYEYDVYLNNQKLKFSYPLQFQTQQHWRWRTDPPAFKFAFGSCAYINDPPFDRPGKPYGSGFETFDAIADQKPDFMLWLGDNIYYREPDWLTESAMRYRFAQNRELPELQRLLASTHHYAIWDDHDYGPNDSDRTYRGKDWALRVFQDYWANNTYGHDDLKGVFGRFEWADVEFFLLDNRFHRSPNKSQEADKGMYGEKQMKWLRESLLNSEATFKIILGGNQMLNPLTPWEAWVEYPEEQKRFFDFLKESKIEGVLFLSGDRHYAELLKRDDITDYPLYDFTSSPLSAGNSRPSKDKEANNPYRVNGTLVLDVKNFGLVEVSGAKDDRKLTLKSIDSTGKEHWKREIGEKDLKVKK
jgi:alkaline phosphatase D